MVTDPNESTRSTNGLPYENPESASSGLSWFLALAALAFVLPIAAVPFLGVYWGAGSAILVFVLWTHLMPTTCMNGGLICSFITMMLLTNTIAILLVASIRLLAFLFS